MSFLNPYIVSCFFVFIFGLCIGSFLNLVIYRLPLNLSIVTPRSRCTSCEKEIPPFALIPILSFFFLGGKCFYCKDKISWRYPLIEFLSGVVTLLLFLRYFNEFKFIEVFYSHAFHIKLLIPYLTSLWLLYTGIALSAIDIKYRILPDVITLPGIIVGILLSTLNPSIGFIHGILGAVVGFAGLFLITKLYEILRKQEGMGFGDVKYLGFIGAAVGVQGVFFTLFLASILGSIIGIIYGLVTKQGLKASIPFGPFLAAGAFLVYLMK